MGYPNMKRNAMREAQEGKILMSVHTEDSKERELAKEIFEKERS